MTRNNSIIYPVLPLRDLVMFPKMIAPLFVGRDSSIKALESIDPLEQKILLVAQRDQGVDVPKSKDIFKVGVVSKVLQVLKLQSSNVKILVEGVEKVKIVKFTEEEFLSASVKPLHDNYEIPKEEMKVIYKTIREQFEEYVKVNRSINDDVLENVLSIREPIAFFDAVTAHLMLSVEKKQKLLESLKIRDRLGRLMEFINGELEFLNAENLIKSRVKNQIEKSQRDYYLNEQLKAIHKELGDEDGKDDLNELTQKLKKKKLTKEAKDRVESELKKLRGMNPFSSEANVLRNYLDWMLDIPWNHFSPIKKDLKKAEEILDDEHYGLEKVKERIIEYLAVGIRTSNIVGPIICLVGPPGVGKTSLARSVANATGRKFVKVALGGLRDEAEIKGHRRTYIGAMPGKIIQAMKKAGTNNPLILLDEIDKMGTDHRSDPAAALLEVLDPEQNKIFNDHYLEVDYDLSKVMFITTANSLSLPRPLLDRLEIIRLSGYTEEEKSQIAKNYLIPKQAKAHGLKKDEFNMDDSATLAIIRYYTRESGVRNLDREVAKIMRKCVKKITLEKTDKVTINSENINDFLGVKKYLYGSIKPHHTIGITNGLSYSEVGGDLLEIEAVVLHGKGEVKITGKLGDVMKESVLAAISYIRSKAEVFGIDLAFFKEHDIHLHVPEGAVPKDGPSAGISICTSITSAVTKIPVRNDIAMTGEITLGGRVLGIGGLKEKLLAAVRGGVTTAIIPSENMKDMAEMPQNIKEKLNVIPVTTADEVLNLALIEDFKARLEANKIKVSKPIIPKQEIQEESIRH